jgi:hypothetical protein
MLTTEGDTLKVGKLITQHAQIGERCLLKQILFWRI